MSKKPFGLAVKAVVNDKEGNCLVIRRSMASKNYAGKWDLPGGKVDPGENVAVALCREVMEETALEVDIDKVLGVTEFDMPAVRAIVLFFETNLAGGTVVLSGEHDDYRWVPRSRILEVDLSEQIKKFFQENRDLSGR